MKIINLIPETSAILSEKKIPAAAVAFFASAVLFLISFCLADAQEDKAVMLPVYSPAGVQCSGGEIHDLGIVGSNLGWTTTATSPVGACLKFVPGAYPFRYSKFCMNFARVSTGTVNWTLKLYMWKSVNNYPGPKLDSLDVNVSPAAIPNWNWYDFELPPTWKEVTAPDSVFIGFLFDPSVYTGGFFAMDCSASLARWPGYTTQGGILWNNVTTPTYKCWLMRAEGAPVNLAHDITVTDFLSTPSAWYTGTNYNFKARVKNNGTSAETNVPVKLFVDGTQYGSTATVNLAAGAVDSVSFSWTPSTPGPHRLKLASALTTDLYRQNDTVPLDVRTVQIPSYYNYINGTGANAFPFSVSTGKAVNSLFPAGAFNQPSPIPSGKSLSKIYFALSSGVPAVYNNLQILMAQDVITSLSTFYPGPYDTVYNHAADSLSFITEDMFLRLTLDHPFPYDPSKSLIVFIGQCGSTTSGYGLKTTISSVVRRVFSVGGCPFAVNGSSALDYNMGFDVITTSGIQNELPVPANFTVEQNYPNPFNPFTTIRYNLPKGANVVLKVYDNTGREVKTLVNEYRSAGSYETVFDGQNLSSGIYFYRIQAGEFTFTRNMVLIK